MKWILTTLLGLYVLLFWLGCARSESPVKPSETIIVKEYDQIDTLSSDTVRDTSSVIIDSIVSDTVVTIKPISETVEYVIVSTKTVYDTTYKLFAQVESAFVYYYISQKTIIDSFFTLLDTTHSDTIIFGNDTLYEIFITPVSIDSIDTIFYSDTVFTDTQYVSAYLFATTSDYNIAGNVGIAAFDWLVFDTLVASSSGLLPIHTNNSIYIYNSSIYILESSGADNIIRINGLAISPDSVVYVYKSNIGTAVDLHDISFANETKVYITQYNSDILVVFDPENGIITGGIYLGEYGMFAGTDSAEVPFMQCSKVVNNKLYVLCQRLETVQSALDTMPLPTNLTGLIVVISTVNDSILKTIPLTKKNPVSMDAVGGYLYVSSTGSWQDTSDGGIEKIDLGSDSYLGVIIEEARFGSNISNIVMISSTKGYVGVSRNNADSTEYWTELVEFDPSTGTVGLKIANIDDASGGEVYDGFYLYVGDRSKTNPGVVVINPTDNSKVAGPIILGPEPPSSIAVRTVSQ